MRDQKRVLAVAHDVVRDQSLSVEEGRESETSRFPWREDMSRKEVASVEEGRDVERVAEMMRVSDERVGRESW